MEKTINDLKIEEIEKRLSIIEKKLEYFDSYIKSDIKSSLQEKDSMNKIKNDINFLDEKIEHQK
jgi:tetrahydromethanopterin S-methyltransferase subunit G